MEERAVEEARAAFLAMLMRNSVSWHAMVSRFASAGDMDMADECFGDALEREDTSFWTTMMSGYMDTANVEKAISGNASGELGFMECGGFWLCEEFTPGG
jgi:pentatricopeptide repeat protein